MKTLFLTLCMACLLAACKKDTIAYRAAGPDVPKCPDGKVPEWNAALNKWVCANPH